MVACGDSLSCAAKKSVERLFLFAANAIILLGSKLFVVFAIDTGQLF